MKAVLNGMTDPYLHMILAVLVLIGLATSFRQDETTATLEASRPVRCEFCRGLAHDLQHSAPLVARASETRRPH